MRILRCSSQDVYGAQFFVFDENVDFQSRIKEIINQPDIGRKNFWFTYMNDEGFYCKDVIVDHIELQTRWYESYLSKNPSSPLNLLNILIQQIDFYQIDVLFANDLHFFTIDVMAKIKKAFPKIKIIIYDGVLKINSALKQYVDLVLCPLSEFVEIYQLHGFSAAYFPFGVNPEMVQKIKTTNWKEKANKLVFLGSINPKMHEQRYDIIKFLTGKIVDFDLYFNEKSLLRLVAQREKNFYLNRISNKFLGRPILKEDALSLIDRNMGYKSGLEYLETLSSYRIVLNKHMDRVNSNIGNIRIFEAGALGTCVVTDEQKVLNKKFSENCVVEFKNKSDAFKKIKYLFKNPEFAREVAENLRNELFTKHNYEDISLILRRELQAKLFLE